MSSSPAIDSCPICDGRIARVASDHEIRIGRRTVTVNADLPTCSSCGESFLTPVEADALQKRASNSIREQEKLLTPEEIRAIRVRLGLTQGQLETLLGTGPKTVVRWERGTVFQNGATDSLLRVVGKVPQAVHFLAQLRGVGVGPFMRTQNIATQIPSDSATPYYEYAETEKPARVLMFPQLRDAADIPKLLARKEVIG
jgi:HTH-type transcriptional regulator/antitoxin MqsA